MTDENSELGFEDRIERVFEGQPRGQRVRAQATGRTRMGDFTITLEQELPTNAEAQPDGVRQQIEMAFHAAFGRSAKHVDPDSGEENPNLNESIVVDIEGDFDTEAAESAQQEVERIVTEEIDRRKQQGMGALLAHAIRPDDGPASLN